VLIQEMSRPECHDALARAKFGRLACAHDNQPYVLPFDFAFDGDCCLYCFTTFGQKVQWMRSNPLVSFEIDEVKGHNHWLSVIVFGRYEELPDKPEYEEARRQAYAYLQKRAMWWEPAYISQEHQATPHSLTPIFFRIRIEKITGHHATADTGETDLSAQPRNAQVLNGHWTRIVKAAVVYFAIVFGAGSVFGPVRVMLAVPRLGERMAELLEAPLMLIVMILAAKFVVRRFQLPPDVVNRLGVGVIAFGLGLLFEFGVVLKLRGITLTEYFETRDPIATTVYYLLLVLFAFMPLLVRRKSVL
jgi:nitroimidazol reductase NimA-like FMN-containing flavoprotein (pyridoxamine 5'-phosphate oxidase superfamily)